MSLSAQYFFPMVLFLAVACQVDHSREPGHQVVARVKTKLLYKEELAGVVPPGSSPADSLRLVHRYIDNWIRRQLLLEKALKEMTINEKVIERQVEDYRNALLLFEFEKFYLHQQLDTLITTAQIDSFYRQHQEEFRLQEPVVKARMLQLDAELSQLPDVKRWIVSTKTEDIAQLKAFSLQYAIGYSLNDSVWIPFKQLILNTPLEKEDINLQSLRRATLLQKEEEGLLYLLYILDAIPVGGVAPVSYVEERIRQMIYNQRRVQLIKQLEDEVYIQAKQNKLFEVYEAK